MNWTYSCPECGNMLLKITKIENGKDVDHYYCDICNVSYKLKQLDSKKSVNSKIIKKPK